VTLNDGSWIADDTKLGAGNYFSGNAETDPAFQGGGSGCHMQNFDPMGIDQTDATDPNTKQNIVGDYACRCNDYFQDDWETWVTQWISSATPKSVASWQGWFAGGKAPSWAVNIAACWLNNPRDMMKLQNAIWNKRSDWSNQLVPKSSWDGSMVSQRVYWGWNEVPVNRTTMEDSTNWDAVFVKLPAAICGENGNDQVSCLSSGAQVTLETDLEAYVSAGRLLVGETKASSHPGSATVFLREVRSSSGAWSREFYCEAWTGPSGKRQIVSGNNLCYFDNVATIV